MKKRSSLIDVLNAKEPERRPVWLMRQAGRYLPEYRAVRQKAGSFLDLCYNPALASEVTLQPLLRFDLDAAILFSDILVVPHAMGLGLTFVENEGPKLETVSDQASVSKLLGVADHDQYVRVAETVSNVRRYIADGKALIGFCGAPWTVATYMIEGGSSKRANARAIAIDGPQWFGDLIDRIVAHSVHYLVMQIKAGVQAVQIFDSWAGDLPEAYREMWIATPIARIVEGVRTAFPEFPVIVFARGVGMGHGEIARATAANAVGVEQDVDLSGVLADLPDDCALQGNLAPEVLAGGGALLEQKVASVLGQVQKGRHVFNLGHGIVPQTPPDHVSQLIKLIRAYD